MPVLQLPTLRLQVVTIVNERSNAHMLARNGYIDTVGGKNESIVLNASAVSIHPTVCTRCMRSEQLVLATEGTNMFQFPACTYEFKQQPHLGPYIYIYSLIPTSSLSQKPPRSTAPISEKGAQPLPLPPASLQQQAARMPLRPLATLRLSHPMRMRS